jgi:hypothetical protein
MANPLLNQVSNRNFLSPIGFKLKINKCPKVDFLATGCNLPGVTLGSAVQPFPESQKQFIDLRAEDVYYPNTVDRDNPYAEFSDATLQILNSNLRPQAHVKLEGMFPVSLTGLDFNATDTDVNYLTASVTFKYLYFKLTDKNNNEL